MVLKGKGKVIATTMITIVICTLIIRVLTIGYLIGGFVLKFHENVIDDDLFYVLDAEYLGVLPLGSTVNYLVLSLMPFIVIYSIVGFIGFCGVFKRNKHLLILHAAAHILLVAVEIVYVGFFAWILYDIYNSLYDSFYNFWIEAQRLSISDRTLIDNWQTVTQRWNCCGFGNMYTSRPNPIKFGGSYTGECYVSQGCDDVLSSKLRTYGSCYTTGLVLNIVFGVACVIATDYIYRVERLTELEREGRTRVDMDKDIHHFKHGMMGDFYRFLKGHWINDKMKSVSAYIKVFEMVFEVGVWVSIVVLRYSWLRDYWLMTTMSSDILNIDGISMDYLISALYITLLCVIPVSFSMKVAYFLAMYSEKKVLFVVSLSTEMSLTVIEVLVLVFMSYPLRMLRYIHDPSWTRAATLVWTSTAFLILHIILKVVQVMFGDRIYKSTFYSEEEERAEFRMGFFTTTCKKIRSSPLKAACYITGICVIVFNTLFFCGLLIIRYDGHSEYQLVSLLYKFTLHGVYIGTYRDVAYIMTLVILPLLIVIQILNFIGIVMQSSKIMICVFVAAIVISISYPVSITLIGFVLRLLYCCDNPSDCGFSNSSTVETSLCNHWENMGRQIWLFFAFIVTAWTIQIVAVILCDRLYKNVFKTSGAFTVCLRFVFHTVKRLANTYRGFIPVNVVTMIVEVGFGIAIYVYFFEKVLQYPLQSYLSSLSKHRYNMQYLVNGVSYTLLGVLPVAFLTRLVSLLLTVYTGYTRWIYFYIAGMILLILGEIVLLTESSYILDMAYDCSSTYSYTEYYRIQSDSNTATMQTNWNEFCSCSGVMFNIAGVSIACLVVHILFNIVLVIQADMIYSIKKDDGDEHGALRRVVSKVKELWRKHSGNRKVLNIYLIVQVISMMWNILILFGLFLMGLTPGYIHVKYEDFLCDTSEFDIWTYGLTFGLLYSTIGSILLNTVIRVFGIVVFLRQSSKLLTLWRCLNVFMTIADLAQIVLSAILMAMACVKEPLLHDSTIVLLVHVSLTAVSHVSVLILSCISRPAEKI